MLAKVGFDFSGMKRNSLCHAKGLLDWLCRWVRRIAESMRFRSSVIISSESLSTPIRHPLGEEKNFLKIFRLGIEALWRYPRLLFDFRRNETLRMGFLSALIGNASEVDASKLEKEFSELLIDGEEIQHAYKLFRDLVVFTNFRLFLVNKQGMTGKKREYTCVPYKSIDYFTKETAGHFDLDAEIKIWIKNRSEPVILEFRKDANIHDVFRVLSSYSLAT